MADLSGLDEEFAELKKLNQEVVCHAPFPRVTRSADLTSVRKSR
jgi:hypothetical protein